MLRFWLGAGTGVVPAAALGLSRSALGLALAAAELTALASAMIFGLIMTLAILRGSDVTSERAFRLLRFLGDRPEPSAPGTEPERITGRRAPTR
jgi:hypothetical protein